MGAPRIQMGPPEAFKFRKKIKNGKKSPKVPQTTHDP